MIEIQALNPSKTLDTQAKCIYGAEIRNYRGDAARRSTPSQSDPGRGSLAFGPASNPNPRCEISLTDRVLLEHEAYNEIPL
jgi:hypothetical protein